MGTYFVIRGTKSDKILFRSEQIYKFYMSFSPNVRRRLEVVSANAYSTKGIIRNLDNNVVLSEIPYEYSDNAIFSGNGETVVIQRNKNYYNKFDVYNALDGKHLQEIEPDFSNSISTVSQNGQFLAVASFQNVSKENLGVAFDKKHTTRVKIFDTKTGELVKIVQTESPFGVTVLQFSKNNDILFVGEKKTYTDEVPTLIAYGITSSGSNKLNTWKPQITKQQSSSYASNSRNEKVLSDDAWLAIIGFAMVAGTVQYFKSVAVYGAGASGSSSSDDYDYSSSSSDSGSSSSDDTEEKNAKKGCEYTIFVADEKQKKELEKISSAFPQKYTIVVDADKLSDIQHCGNKIEPLLFIDCPRTELIHTGTVYFFPASMAGSCRLFNSDNEGYYLLNKAVLGSAYLGNDKKEAIKEAIKKYCRCASEED